MRTAQKRAGKPQWLLIKRDDEHARDADADTLLSGPAAEKPTARKRRASTEAARSGPRRRPRNADWPARAAALPGAKPKRAWKPLDPQLATLREAPPPGDDWLHELKWGRLPPAGRGQGRQGVTSLPQGPGLDQRLSGHRRRAGGLGVADGSFDGELIALNPKGVDDFGLLQKTIEGSADAPLRYMLFDMPSLAGSDLTAARLVDRKHLLEALLEAPIQCWH